MRRAVMAARLQDIRKANQIGMNVIVRMVDAVPDSRLRRKMDHPVEAVARKAVLDGRLVREIPPDKSKRTARLMRGSIEDPQPRFLKARIVIGVERIEPNHLVASFQQRFGDMIANEACGSRNKDFQVKDALRRSS